MAFINGGGVRASLSSGDVTKEEILSVNPFGNLLCKREVTGQVILDALEFGTRLLPEESGSFLQVSGLTYEIHADLPSSVVTDEDGMFVSIDGEYRVQNVMIAGEPIDVDKMYTVVAPNYFLKNFGDGFTMFNSGELLMEDFMLDADALIEYFNNEYRDCSDSYQNPYGEGRINAARK